MDDPRRAPSGSPSPGREMNDRDLVLQFESLGGTGHGCEFGLFQRHFGAEPLGLLRWADLSHDLLIRALETRFDGVGLAEHTIVFNPEGSDEWWTRDNRFWMAMRSFVRVADVDLERMTIKVCRRLQFLRRKLIEDLEDGDKIFVFKNMQRNLSETELARLHAAVRSYGDSTLLYIQYADETHPNGTVEVRGPGLMVGFIDHFAFSPDDKPLGPVNDSFYVLCKLAYEMFAGWLAADAPALPAPAVMPFRGRRVAVIGNCQAQAMMNLYKRFVAGRNGELLTHIPTYEDLTPKDRTTIEQADLIVEQLFDLKPQADTAGIATGAPRVFLPMVTAGFLWPFAGQPHPRNVDYPFLTGGPYGGEASDSYLNRMILAGTDPEEAVDTYMQLDIRARTNLDRMYELIMDRQRSRDEAADYRIAEVIEQHFRTEQIFLSPYHPNTRVAVALGTQFFRQMGADRQDIERMQDCTRVTPFPKGELPLHPSVCKHFGLAFVAPDRRYRFMNEGHFTFREYALRYMRYEWNEALEEGLNLVHRGKLGAARERLIAGVAVSPASSAGHNALSHVLGKQDALDEAAAEARRAVEIEPESASYHAHLGLLLRRLGHLDEAEAELRAAITADPMEPHNFILLAHFLRSRDRIEEGCNYVRAALALDPYSAKLHEELAELLSANGNFAGAVLVQRQAITLAPDNADGLRRLSHMLGRLGRMDEAEEAARMAVTLDPQAVRFRIVLSDILLRQGKSQDAVSEALTAAVIDPDSAEVYSHLGHALHLNADPAAETALRRAASLDPTNAHVRHQLSEVLKTTERLGEAIAAAREATELEPGNPHRFVHLSRLFLMGNNLMEAEAAQRQAVAAAPKDSAHRVVLSDLLARTGRREEALIEARLAVEFHPDSAHALGHLAHIMQLLGNLEESEALYLRALDLAPGDDHMRRQLSHVQARRLQDVRA